MKGRTEPREKRKQGKERDGGGERRDELGVGRNEGKAGERGERIKDGKVKNEK